MMALATEIYLVRDREGDKDLFKDRERDKERMLQLRKWRRERGYIPLFT